MLTVKNLKTYFHSSQHDVVKAVDDVSFEIAKGESVGLVGESGSGKSILSLSLLRLVPPPGKIVSGEIIWQGKDLSKFSEEAIREVRGKNIAMIFQEPMTSLNPVFTIGDQIAEGIQTHEKVPDRRNLARFGMGAPKVPGSFGESARHLSAGIRSRVIELLKLVGIPAPETRFDDYPHQMSGGMRQRVMIAMALACKPDLLIADEPTTALDVTIQAQILELLRNLQAELGMALLLITHDFGVVAEMAHRVLVMVRGKIVEEASCGEIFKNPKHPYTKRLLDAILPLGKKVPGSFGEGAPKVPGTF